MACLELLGADRGDVHSKGLLPSLCFDGFDADHDVGLKLGAIVALGHRLSQNTR